MADIIFSEGIYFSEKREGAPDFVLGSISIRPEQLTKWLSTQKSSETGYVKLDILRSKKTGKPYCAVNTFVPIKKVDSAVKSEIPIYNAVKTEIPIELNDDGIVTKISDVPF